VRKREFVEEKGSSWKKKRVRGRDSARQSREKEKEGETRAMTGGVMERVVADDKIRRALDIPYSSACFCNWKKKKN